MGRRLYDNILIFLITNKFKGKGAGESAPFLFNAGIGKESDGEKARIKDEA